MFLPWLCDAAEGARLAERRASPPQRQHARRQRAVEKLSESVVKTPLSPVAMSPRTVKQARLTSTNTSPYSIAVAPTSLFRKLFSAIRSANGRLSELVLRRRGQYNHNNARRVPSHAAATS